MDDHFKMPDYGKCDECGLPASMTSSCGGKTERLCSSHAGMRVKRANLETFRKQMVERAGLRSSYRTGTPIVLFVDREPNSEGRYVASVANPILGCDVGFGNTPYRALKDLASKIQDAPDRILQTIVEHEREIHLLEAELNGVDSEGGN